jgi:hypothetical protein
MPDLTAALPSLGILVLIAVSRARTLANAYSAVHLPPLHHANQVIKINASLRHRLASIVSLTPLASPASLASLISPASLAPSPPNHSHPPTHFIRFLTHFPLQSVRTAP